MDKEPSENNAKNEPASILCGDFLVTALDTAPVPGSPKGLDDMSDAHGCDTSTAGCSASTRGSASTGYSASTADGICDIDEFFDMMDDDNYDDDDTKSFSSFVYASAVTQQAEIRTTKPGLLSKPAACYQANPPTLAARPLTGNFKWNAGTLQNENGSTVAFSKSSPGGNFCYSNSSPGGNFCGPKIVGSPSRSVAVPIAQPDSEVARVKSVTRVSSSLSMKLTTHEEGAKATERRARSAVIAVSRRDGQAAPIANAVHQASPSYASARSAAPRPWARPIQIHAVSARSSSADTTMRCSRSAQSFVTVARSSDTPRRGPPRSAGANRPPQGRPLQEPSQTTRAQPSQTTCVRGHLVATCCPTIQKNARACDGCGYNFHPQCDAARFRCGPCDTDLCEACFNQRRRRSLSQPSLHPRRSMTQLPRNASPQRRASDSHIIRHVSPVRIRYDQK